MTYPQNWPRCPHCGDHALDGKATCGRVQCVTAELGSAVHFVNQNYPLPRCPHGNALRDASGEVLEPSCGCWETGR